MNKRSYIDLLKYYLRDLPQNVIDDIVKDYEEHFDLGIENGKTESEIAEELGDPEIIAEEFLRIEPGRRRVIKVDKETGEKIINRSGEEDNNIWKWIAIISLVILLSPLIVGLLGGLVGIVFGVIGLAIGLIFAGFGIIFALIFGGGVTAIGLIPFNLNPLTQVLFALFFIALAIFIIILALKFVEWLIKSIKSLYISLKWRMERQNECQVQNLV